MTKMTYATKDAFKILREKFYQSEEEKVGQRIQALNELLSLKKDKHKRHKILRQDDNLPEAFNGNHAPVKKSFNAESLAKAKPAVMAVSKIADPAMPKVDNFAVPDNK